jgi:tetratricopeptide (TPR) repeat protein
VAAALLVGLALATAAFVRERAARRQAEAAKNLARVELAKNEKIAKFFMNSADPGIWRGQDVTLVRKMLQSLSARVRKELAGEPMAQGDLWLGLGDSFAGTDDYPTAITNLQLAVQAYRSVPGMQPFRLAKVLSRLSRCQGISQDALACRTNAALAVQLARQCNDPTLLATCLLDGGKSLIDSGQFDEAIPFLRESMQLRRKVVPHFLALLDSTRHLVKALEGLAAAGRQDEAEIVLAEELQISPGDGDLRKLRRSFDRKNKEAQQARVNSTDEP